MKKQPVKKNLWGKVKSYAEAKKLLQARSDLISSDHIKKIIKILSEEEQIAFLKEIMNRIAEDHHQKTDKKNQEHLFHAVVSYVVYHQDQNKVLHVIKEKAFDWDSDLTKFFVESILEKNTSDLDEESTHFESAVSLVYDLGLFYLQKNKDSETFNYLTSYLSSLSNHSDIKIRLYLFHFFGKISFQTGEDDYFNKVIDRFGHSLIEHLFSLLFQKKYEAIALDYLLEVLPFALNASPSSQKILHQTFRQYMMKHPEKFFIFIGLLKKEIASKQIATQTIEKNMLHHLTALYAVACELEHQNLAKQIFDHLATYEKSDFYASSIETILKDADIRSEFKKPFISKKEAEENPDLFHVKNDVLKHKKRGRKPVFQRSKGSSIYYQVIYLGKVEAEK